MSDTTRNALAKSEEIAKAAVFWLAAPPLVLLATGFALITLQLHDFGCSWTTSIQATADIKRLELLTIPPSAILSAGSIVPSIIATSIALLMALALATRPRHIILVGVAASVLLFGIAVIREGWLGMTFLPLAILSGALALKRPRWPSNRTARIAAVGLIFSAIVIVASASVTFAFAGSPPHLSYMAITEQAEPGIVVHHRPAIGFAIRNDGDRWEYIDLLTKDRTFLTVPQMHVVRLTSTYQ